MIEKNEQLADAVRRMFNSGSVEVRDALRAVANTVLAKDVALPYEGDEPSVETTYRLLEGIQFSGDGKTLLPSDEIYALDKLLSKKWCDTFFSAVSNMALTMHCTDPRTAGKGYWPPNNSSCCELVTRAFIWTVAQYGLDNLLEKDTSVVSHTRLPQFIIALQTEGKDEGYARHFSLYHPHNDTGNIDTTNYWPDEYKIQQEEKRIASRPAEYDSVRHMGFDELAALCTRLNLIGPNSKVRCDCDEDEEEIDCDCQPMMVEDFDQDLDELQQVFYDKYGDPDEDTDEDESEWITGVSVMEVTVDLPVVRLPEPAQNNRSHLPRRGQKKAMPKSVSRKVTLTHDQQIWHELDSKQEFGDRRFAITLVSRHTCGVDRAIATNREALAVAYTLINIDK